MQSLYQRLIDKSYNTIEIRGDYGTTPTLPDVIETSMYTCFLFKNHFVQFGSQFRLFSHSNCLVHSHSF